MKWIDVKERLPETNKLVLGWVTDYSGEIVLTKFRDNGSWDFGGFDFAYPCDTKDGISHWQELPVSPSEAAKTPEIERINV